MISFLVTLLLTPALGDVHTTPLYRASRVGGGSVQRLSKVDVVRRSSTDFRIYDVHEASSEDLDAPLLFLPGGPERRWSWPSLR